MRNQGQDSDRASDLPGSESVRDSSSKTSQQITPRKKHSRGSVRIVLPLLLIVVCVLAVILGYAWWEYHQVRESTDDAYVHGDTPIISSRIPGNITEVLVEENQYVQRGECLVRLDSKEARVAISQAETAVEIARSRLETARVSVRYSRDHTDAQVEEKQALLRTLRQRLESERAKLEQRRKEVQGWDAALEKSVLHLFRMKSLHETGVVSREALDDALAAEKMALANLGRSQAAELAMDKTTEATIRGMDEVQAQIAQAKTGFLSTEMRSIELRSLVSGLEHAQADLEKAHLNLSYTEIFAPTKGFISKKNVDVGNNVQPGRALMSIVPLQTVWVRANFKEGQLEEIRIGQPVKIVADAYPDEIYTGKVHSISSGTGDAFSLLPPENATGNWVKITRRVPVKILLDEPPPEEFPLRIGMSVGVVVDTHDRSGPRLTGQKFRAKTDTN